MDSGGKIKSYHALRTLARAHQVQMLAYVRSDQELGLVPEVEEICAGVTVVPLTRGPLRLGIDLMGSLLARRSFIVSRDYRRSMADAFERAVTEFQPEVVHIDHLQMAQFVRFGEQYRTVLDQHNVESVIIRRLAESSSSLPVRLWAGAEWPKLRDYETGICRRCDLVLAVSDQDAAAIRDMDPRIKRVECVPIGVDVERFANVPRNGRAGGILSVGAMHWPPNVDAAVYFCRDILPLIRHDVPQVSVTIAGQRPTAQVRALADPPGVEVTGYVEDERELAKECAVFVVPLRSGSGVRVKILNALAMGLPVVSTPIGAEGLDVIDGQHLLIADGARDFAAAVVTLLRDRDTADRLGRAGQALVTERYSWDKTGARLLELYETI